MNLGSISFRLKNGESILIVTEMLRQMDEDASDNPVMMVPIVSKDDGTGYIMLRKSELEQLERTPVFRMASKWLMKARQNRNG